MPPEYSVDPSSAKPGDKVTVAAADATCDPRYGANAQIQVTVYSANGTRILQELAPMNDAGGFRFVFNVPAGAAPGEAAVTAEPHGLDWCDDAGRNNRAAPGRAGVVPALVSCAQRMQPLTIAPAAAG
ncbi:hypothetical protein V3C33_17300 [Micrococcaceae bacterium Sec5.7]